MRLRVGHLEVAVSPMEMLEVRSEDRHGCYYPLTQEIRVDPTLTAAEKRRVLIHEVIHAMWHAYRIADEVDEEAACGALDRAFTQVLRDNAELVAAMTGAKELFK